MTIIKKYKNYGYNTCSSGKKLLPFQPGVSAVNKEMNKLFRRKFVEFYQRGGIRDSGKVYRWKTVLLNQQATAGRLPIYVGVLLKDARGPHFRRESASDPHTSGGRGCLFVRHPS